MVVLSIVALFSNEVDDQSRAMPPVARKQNDQLTVPAPPSGEEDPVVTITFGNVERPTSVPDYDVEALAAESFQSGSAKRAQLPLDLAVPIRNARASADGAPLRAAFLLSHVDDRLSIAEIASSAQLPVADVIENFVLLADLGVVELRGSSHVPPPQQPTQGETAQQQPTNPKSGLRPKT